MSGQLNLGYSVGGSPTSGTMYEDDGVQFGISGPDSREHLGGLSAALQSTPGPSCSRLPQNCLQADECHSRSDNQTK